MESVTKRVIKSLRNLKRCSDSPLIRDEIDDAITAISQDVNPCEQLKDMTKRVCAAIEAMSSTDVSHSNTKSTFRARPILHHHADKCIEKIEATGEDSRDLSVAFDNAFWRAEGVNLDLTEGECLFYDMPHELSIAVMDWMTTLAIEKSPYWVKWTCKIPIGALVDIRSFETFVIEFSNIRHKSEIDLRASGRRK